MYCNTNSHHRDKSKTSDVKPSSSQHLSNNSKSKAKKHLKPRSSTKHSKFKQIAAVESDYFGAKRLTNHVGIFNKGKISDSISRLEKRMPSEVRARADQDLHKVLKLKNLDRYKHRSKGRKKQKALSLEKTVIRSVCRSEYFCPNSGFASTSWQDKLQKSVGHVTVNDSILASVHQQPKKKSPVNEELFMTQKTLISDIHPSIKEANNILFPGVSNKFKIKNKLLQIKKQLEIPIILPFEENSVSSDDDFISSEISSNVETKNSSQSVFEDFVLNPIFTGEPVNHSDITEIFPPAKSFCEYEENKFDYINTSDLLGVNYKNDIKTSEMHSSSSRMTSSSVILVPSSPASSEGSPSWKLRLSPNKFIPLSIPSPTIYYRHKMF